MTQHRLYLQRKTPLLLVAALGLGAAFPVLAATTTTTFQVTASVLDSCLVTATDLAFGTYDPNSGGVLDGSSVITALCTAGTDYEIALDVGANAADTSATTRAMIGEPGSFLEYELYSDAARSSVWGDTSGSDTVAATGGLTGINLHTVYGQIPAAQYVAADDYADTINVTITY
ncbi:Csu type fimbrial protein [Cobetia sp. L2A1]|uniref:Csu type fimbrial protein n=1 Tax=Cobetia sp. L2A1 TaxID=2686360 RepID=UPI00131AC280|nr:spore coat U domain-containing protein [Cobetia sp. L2A1]